MGCVSCVGLSKEILAANNPVVLRLKEPSTIPVEAESICPDLFVNLTYKEITDLPLYYGRRNRRLGDLFFVDGEKSDCISIETDVGNVKKIGARMTRGKIEIHGNVGRHVGASMSGGEIVIMGNAADKAGIHMQGGLLWIKGNAGHQTGSAYPGENRGMNRGVIIVEGNSGVETGACMRRGLIAVLGDAGDFTGARMVAGSVFVFGHLGKRAGAGMKRGSVVACGTSEQLLPTFYPEVVMQPVIVKLILNYLQKIGVSFDPRLLEGFYQRHSGDINTVGKGEILIHVEH